MKIDGYKIECLKAEIEKKLGRTFKSPVDFDYLALKIGEEPQSKVSISTLKRLWNYVSYTSSPSLTTLSSLARFIGYTDWDHYVTELVRRNVEDSGFLSIEQVRTRDLHVGDELYVEWAPDRQCRFEFLGGDRFKVKESVNSKLSVGDTFAAILFGVGAPLYITDLIHDGSTQAVSYVAGERRGLTAIQIVVKK